VLERPAPSGLTGRNLVTAASKAGLVLTVSGDERRAPWEAVDIVVAMVTVHGQGEMFVLALEIDEGEATRLFVVAEIDRIWPELTAMLPIGLPAIEPFERWGAALADKPGVVTLYERPASRAAS
jgi:hypothetical protein